MQTIDQYKDLAIECALQKSELVVESLAKSKAEKYQQIITLLEIFHKDAVIEALKNAIEIIEK